MFKAQQLLPFFFIRHDFHYLDHTDQSHFEIHRADSCLMPDLTFCTIYAGNLSLSLVLQITATLAEKVGKYD